MLLTIVGYLYIFSTVILHPFHVSVCEIYHNEKTRSLEISMKIFIDDLELAIQQDGESDFKLLEVDAEFVDNEPIENYLKKKFRIKVDGELITQNYLGFEFDNDAILCYLEKARVKKINTIEIDNAIITEVYDDQINLTHFQYKGEMKSIKAVKDRTIGIVDTSNF